MREEKVVDNEENREQDRKTVAKDKKICHFHKNFVQKTLVFSETKIYNGLVRLYWQIVGFRPFAFGKGTLYGEL